MLRWNSRCFLTHASLGVWLRTPCLVMDATLNALGDHTTVSLVVAAEGCRRTLYNGNAIARQAG